MNICVISPSKTSISAKKLAEILGATYVNPFKSDSRDFRHFDLVFNYGANRGILANNIINKPHSVNLCVDKAQTLYHLSRCGIPCVAYSTKRKEIPTWWKTIVVREDRTSNSGKGLSFVEKGETLPENGEFFTEYFDAKFEFRILILKGKVIGRYLKEEDGHGQLDLTAVDADGFTQIDTACLRAAEILNIDYVGFDVLAKSQKDFKIIEANSGPILPNDVTDKIKAILNV